jgi:outer membrane protein assembly factor BamB
MMKARQAHDLGPLLPCSWVLLSLLLAACGTIDETRIPAELTDIETTLRVEDRWSRDAGSGVGDLYLKLKPVVASDELYVVDAAGTVSALQAASGEILWQVELDMAVIAGLQRGEGSIFLGTEDGLVMALSRADGHELWREQLGAEVMALSNASLGTLVARTSDSRLYGLDARSGDVLWQTARTTPVLNLRGASQPVAEAGRVVIGFDDGKLLAVSPVRGEELWTTSIAAPSGRSELERMVDLDGEIKVVDGIVYATSFQGRVAAVTLSDGRILWSRQMSSHMGLDVDAEHVYVTDADGNVTALDRTNGATLWKQDKLEHRQLTAPVAIGEYVLVGDFEGYAHWLSKYDGHFVARTRFDSAGILSTPPVVDDTAYVLDRAGTIAALSIVEGKTTPADPRPSVLDELRSEEKGPDPLSPIDAPSLDGERLRPARE